MGSKAKHSGPLPRWLRHTLAWAAMFSFACSAKLHLPFVQLTAWSVMAANYAEIMPANEAVRLAVTGKELCGGCRYVRSADHARQTQDAILAKSLSAEQPPALDARPADLPPPPAPRLIGLRHLVARSALARRDPPELSPPRALRD